MRLILQLCLLVLMLLGAEKRAWGKVATSPQTAVRDWVEDSRLDGGIDAPPRQPTSGEAAAWDADMASAGDIHREDTLTMSGPVVVTSRGAAFLMCPGAPPPFIGSIRTTTPAWVAVGPNVYAYVKQNPWTGFDPHGLWVEDLAIGVPSIGVGAASLWSNIKKGNVGSAIWDGVGIVADAAAVAIPGVPGGVGLATKAARAAAKVATKVEKVVEKVEKVQEAVEVATAVASGDPTVIVEKLVDKAVDKAMGGKKGKGGDAPGSKGQKQVQAEAKTKADAAAKSGETAATKRGREEHKKWEPGEGFEKEVTLPSGKRADAVNVETKEVKELKPDNARAVKRGEKQVEQYRQELEKKHGGTWTGRVETYK